MARRTGRPGRTLLIFALGIVILYGLASLGGTWKPRLGLDLEGGTRITLTAAGNSKDITSDKLKQAASIIDSRVNGSGVAEAEVTTQSSKNIIVEIPGKNRKDLVDSVERTAQLRFRIVAEPGSGLPQGSATQPPAPSATSSAPAKPGSTPGKKSTAATPAPTAGGAPRVAPKLDQTPSPTPTTGATPNSTPTDAAATPGATPTGSTSGTATSAPQPPACITAAKQTKLGAKPDVDSVMAWRTNPEPAWLQCYAVTKCPPKGQASSVLDDPDLPMVACDESGNKFLLSRAVIEGTELKTASYGPPPQGVGWAVNLSFKSSARKTFGTMTKALFSNGGQFAIVLDSQVISSAGVNEPILDGNAQITGSFKEAEAKSLANSLKFGALPIRFENPPTVETIGPSLAGSQLSAGIGAGIVGLLIVMLYCLLYYRGLGLVVIGSLAIAGVITYATVLVLAQAAGFALTLPGIAGLIVAVGITADSFIVYFERIRDEMRDGKSARVAVESGWVRARNTCLAADAVSFLAAVVLYIFAIGVVRGFAFTLGISTIIDVVVFFWFTKPMVTYLVRHKYFATGHKLSGLSPETLGIDRGGPQYVGGNA